MKPIEVADKIFLYKGTDYTSNTYYINDKTKVLIDAGYDFKGEVDLLVLTHFHPDHIIYSYNIKERSGCKVLIGEKDLEPLRVFIKKQSIFGCGKTIEPDPLSEGDEIKTGQYTFCVLEAPGHTIGSIMLWEPRARILFSGDTKFAGTGIGRTDMPYSDPGKMDETLKRINELKPFLLLPGHLQIEQLK